LFQDFRPAADAGRLGRRHRARHAERSGQAAQDALRRALARRADHGSPRRLGLRRHTGLHALRGILRRGHGGDHRPRRVGQSRRAAGQGHHRARWGSARWTRCFRAGVIDRIEEFSRSTRRRCCPGRPPASRRSTTRAGSATWPVLIPGSLRSSLQFFLS